MSDAELADRLAGQGGGTPDQQFEPAEQGMELDDGRGEQQESRAEEPLVG